MELRSSVSVASTRRSPSCATDASGNATSRTGASTAADAKARQPAVRVGWLLAWPGKVSCQAREGYLPGPRMTDPETDTVTAFLPPSTGTGGAGAASAIAAIAIPR